MGPRYRFDEADRRDRAVGVFPASGLTREFRGPTAAARRRQSLRLQEQQEQGFGVSTFHESLIVLPSATWISSFFISSMSDGRIRPSICSWPRSATPTS